MSLLKMCYLWLKQITKNALALCSICGNRGVDSISLRHPESMCYVCDHQYQTALRELGSTQAVEQFIKDFGKIEFQRKYDPYQKRNPLALKLEEEDNVPCYDEEIPCFDTFPGHPAQNCSIYDRAKSMGISSRTL